MVAIPSYHLRKIMSNYANASQKRGSALEAMFDRWIEHWNKRIHMRAYRLEVRYNMAIGRYTKKQDADYLIITPTSKYLLDSKECSSEYFYPSRQPAHQLAAMEKFQNNLLGIAGFVVWFKEQDSAGVNLRFIRNLVEKADINSGTRFDWEKIGD